MRPDGGPASKRPDGRSASPGPDRRLPGDKFDREGDPSSVGSRPAERAPHLATGVVVGVTLSVAAALATRVGPGLSVVLAALSGTAFAASLWLVDRERLRLPASVVAGTLSLLVGAGVAVAVGFAALELVARLYPVPEISQIRPQGLRLTSATVVVAGATLAVVGALASVGSVLRRDTARAYASLSVKTFVVPLAVAALLVLPAVTGRVYTPLDPVLNPVVALVDGALGALFRPRPRRTHLFTFLVLGVVTSVALDRGLARFPVAVLPADRRDRAVDRLESVRRGLQYVSVGLAALGIVSLAEFAVPQFTLDRSLGPVYDLLVAVTAARWLRTLAFFVVAASAAWVGAVELLGAFAGTTPRELALGTTPFVGGGAVVVLVVLAHGAVVEPTLTFVADSLPPLFGLAFERQTGAILRYFGSAAVGLVLAALLVGLTALGSLALAFGATMGSLPDRAVGPALAATGLFVAAAFAGAAGVNAGLVLAGVVAAFLVWDVGEYGAVLGREVGPTHARGPVVAHAGGTLAVGVVLVVGVGAVLTVADWLPVLAGPALPLAFAAVVVGLALTLAALR